MVFVLQIVIDFVAYFKENLGGRQKFKILRSVICPLNEDKIVFPKKKTISTLMSKIYFLAKLKALLFFYAQIYSFEMIKTQKLSRWNENCKMWYEIESTPSHKIFSVCKYSQTAISIIWKYQNNKIKIVKSLLNF